MNTRPLCLLCTQDSELIRQIAGYLQPAIVPRPVSSLEELERFLSTGGSGVVVLDLRGAGLRNVLPRLVQTHPHIVFVVLGRPRSEPLLQAEALNVYAAEDLSAPPRRLQAVIRRAVDYAALTAENRLLRAATPPPPPAAPAPGERSRSWRAFTGAVRQGGDILAQLERVIEDLAHAELLTRAGLFARTREGTFRLAAGVRSLAGTEDLSYEAADPLVLWMTHHAHLIAAPALARLSDPAERIALQESLDALGAEAIVPLHARGELLGWLFAGVRVTGLPFDVADLEDLALAGQFIATALENTLLYEEVALQKTLAAALLQALPSAVVAVDAAGLVRWFNAAAERVWARTADEVFGQPVESLDSRLAGLLRQTIRGEPPPPQEWHDPNGERIFASRVLRLMDGSTCCGAVALLDDVTLQQQREREEQQRARDAFWSDLAAGISHEIRNPLVAIKTFAQLLPERHEDADFRNEFSRMVPEEVERLNAMLDQIQRFAQPVASTRRNVDVRVALRRALARMFPEPSEADPRIDLRGMDEHLPPTWAHEESLIEVFVQLLTNAVEAVREVPKPLVALSARKIEGGREHGRLLVNIRDNGGGIPPDEV